MSAIQNTEYWKSVGDRRSKEQRIQEARDHHNHVRDRRRYALEMEDVNSKLTVEQKIAKLDWRLGKNKGAKKERARLEKLNDAQNAD